MNPMVQGLVTIIVGVGGCVGYFYAANMVLDRVLYPASGPNAGANINKANRIRPWLFLLPAIVALGLYLVYPVIGSFYRSLFDRSGFNFVGLGNYGSLIADGEFRMSLRNNLLWILVVPAASTFFGLLAAQLTDRLSWGNIAKSLIFMPMAISFVGASLIWKFVYANNADIGLINAVRALLGADQAVDVLQIPFWNNFFLMFILIWIQTGFAMVILSAALRGIPEETVEAAVLDGANPFQIFFKIKVPQIMGTIVVVWTTITILVLKIFDIVYATTGGNFGTQILPSYMMAYMFRDDGRATAVAFVIMIIVLPVMIWNIVQARKEMR
jgi:alpha-glucoside transport system permease protein